MHSRKKGKSGSKRPSEIKKVSWEKYKKDEVEAIIVKLAKQGLNPSEIGMHLRDSYGIRSTKVILGKRIDVVLNDNKLRKNIPEDLASLIKRVIKIMEHLEVNKKDMTAKRGLTLTESKIRRLVKYYTRNDKLPSNWKYSREEAKLLVS